MHLVRKPEPSAFQKYKLCFCDTLISGVTSSQKRSHFLCISLHSTSGPSSVELELQSIRQRTGPNFVRRILAGSRSRMLRGQNSLVRSHCAVPKQSILIKEPISAWYLCKKKKKARIKWERPLFCKFCRWKATLSLYVVVFEEQPKSAGGF